ncbi:hypothetical protein M0802_004924 [Mischocyttarus mexicanus]|nr:hypothetical protein M0802_004924 [Mischocyttarus mexicanus]
MKKKSRTGDAGWLVGLKVGKDNLEYSDLYYKEDEPGGTRNGCHFNIVDVASFVEEEGDEDVDIDDMIALMNVVKRERNRTYIGPGNQEDTGVWTSKGEDGQTKDDQHTRRRRRRRKKRKRAKSKREEEEEEEEEGTVRCRV